MDKGSEGESADVMDIDGEGPEVVGLVHSPAKVNRTASIRSGIPTEALNAQRGDIVKMIQQWIKVNGSHDLPTDLTNLALRAQIVVSDLAVGGTTLRWQDKQEKAHPTTPSAADGAVHGILFGLQFVLTSIWPNQGGGCGLTLGKERVKQQIGKHRRTKTLLISNITNVLVTGDCPGKKKVIKAHKRSLKSLMSIRSMISFWGTLS